jgi:tRNA threonylcarbamoyladenosine modification (KEOPS) complex  Pcc1 subunit
MYPVSGCIEVKLPEKRLAEAIAQALDVEAKNPPDPRRASVRVEVQDSIVRICFEARDLSAARTIVNTYLSLAATTIDAVSGAGAGEKRIGSETSSRA